MTSQLREVVADALPVLDRVCRTGRSERDNDSCPNMEADPDDTSMETERYRCLVCGASYKLYYEDMA